MASSAALLGLGAEAFGHVLGAHRGIGHTVTSAAAPRGCRADENASPRRSPRLHPHRAGLEPGQRGAWRCGDADFAHFRRGKDHFGLARMDLAFGAGRCRRGCSLVLHLALVS